MKYSLSAVLVSAALLTGTFAYSNDAKPIRSTTKEISIKSAFHKIELGSNISMVLVQEDENRSSLLIEGDANFIPAVKVNIDKGVLSITSNQNLRGRKIKIYVPVSTLAFLDVAADASVVTEGIIKLDDLKVIIHDGSTADLHIVGNLQVEAGEDCDLVYQTYKKSKVTYVQQ
jgi:hypothetical protein